MSSTAELNWSERTYTLMDIDNDIPIQSCFVRIEEGMELQSFLDEFFIKQFRNIFSVQAFKMSNNEDSSSVSYGEQVTIPISYPVCGTILPLYGTSHVFNTVEELILAYPRFVEVQENLTVCSNSSLVYLKPGDKLELLKILKNPDGTGDKLKCQDMNNQICYLNASCIGKFKNLPDPGSYTIKDTLQRLKLPQIIKFENHTKQSENEPLDDQKQEYIGSFLLVGLHKNRAAVINPISIADNNAKNPNIDSGYILLLDSSLFEHLRYHVALVNDFQSFKFYKPKKKKQMCPDSKEMVEQFKKSDDADIYTVETGVANYNNNYTTTYYTQDHADFYKVDNGMANYNNNYTTTYYTQATAPFPNYEYSEYLYTNPELNRRSIINTEKITKKVNKAFQIFKGKLKSSPKEVTTLCKSISQPSLLAPTSRSLYPTLSKLNLASAESNDNIYTEANNVLLEGQSRFFPHLYPYNEIQDAANSVDETLISKSKLTEINETQSKSEILYSNIGTGIKEKDVKYPPLDHDHGQLYSNIADLLQRDDEGLDISNRLSTLKMNGRRTGVLAHQNNLQVANRNCSIDCSSSSSCSGGSCCSSMNSPTASNNSAPIDYYSVEENIYDDISNIQQSLKQEKGNMDYVSKNFSNEDTESVASVELCPEKYTYNQCGFKSSSSLIEECDKAMCDSPEQPPPLPNPRNSQQLLKHKSLPLKPPPELSSEPSPSHQPYRSFHSISTSQQLPVPLVPPRRKLSLTTTKTNAITNRPQQPLPHQMQSATCSLENVKTPVQMKTPPAPPPSPTKAAINTMTTMNGGTNSDKSTILSNSLLCKKEENKDIEKEGGKEEKEEEGKDEKGEGGKEEEKHENKEENIEKQENKEGKQEISTSQQLPVPLVPPRRKLSLTTTTTTTKTNTITNRPQQPLPHQMQSAICSLETVKTPGQENIENKEGKQEKEAELCKGSFQTASVKEVCEILDSCGLHKLKVICKDNCLDGYFISVLSDSSLEQTPFLLTSIEIMKLKMVMRGWKPKLE